jgi:hypothetical protein
MEYTRKLQGKLLRNYKEPGEPTGTLGAAPGCRSVELPPPKLGIDRMPVAWYREILATAEHHEIEQARRDWQMIARLTEAVENRRLERRRCRARTQDRSPDEIQA